MENTTRNTFYKIQTVMNSLPLQGILETAESVAPLIPAAGTPLLYVIKALKLLIKARPVANSLLSVGASNTNEPQTSDMQSTPVDMASSESNECPAMTDEEKQSANERAEIMTMLDQMIEIAAEDGDLSEEEFSYLMDIAKEVDINEKALIAKVKMKCVQNK